MDNVEILKIDNLQIDFETERGTLRVLRGISLTVHQGEILAVVGESGCGKSVTAHAVMGLNPEPAAQVTAGSIDLCGHAIVGADETEMQLVRGALAGMVFQEHMTGLNPTMQVGRQLTEALRRRGLLPHAQAKAAAVRMLQAVQIPDAARRARQYPHEFSGGMRQRAMIAMALALHPRLLIADEPTTALDLTIQAQILRLLGDIREQHGTAVLLITHDLGVVANLADRVAVMYAGRIVEEGMVEEIFEHPAHPYTVGLLSSIPLYFQRDKPVLRTIPGAPPQFFAPPIGCAFAERCPHREQACDEGEPPFIALEAGHFAACWRLGQGARE